MLQLERLDHLVLTVADIALTTRFYVEVLGCREVDFGDGRKALAFGAQKINLHAAAHPRSPHARQPTPGSADLCFVVATPLAEVKAHLQRCGVAVEAGPVARTGALGPIVSLYLRDPDGNLVELSQYQR